MARKHGVGFLIVVTVAGTAGRAAAQTSEATPSNAKTNGAASPPKDEASSKTRLEWNRPRFHVGEYVATGALLAGVVALSTQSSKSEKQDANWKGGVFVDDAVIGVARAGNEEGRVRAANISDYFLYGMIAFPYLDAGYAAAFRGSSDVAWQMALINTESYALTGVTTTLVKMFVKRERPWVGHCADSNDPSCKSSDSFLSGHTSMAFTSAGLTCAHHQALGLYGNPYADGAACAAAIGMATVTGALRVVADKHYTTDVFAGAALGLASGYLLPKILHYGGFSRSSDGTSDSMAKKKEQKKVAWSAAPAPVQGGAVLSVSGVFF